MKRDHFDWSPVFPTFKTWQKHPYSFSCQSHFCPNFARAHLMYVFEWAGVWPNNQISLNDTFSLSSKRIQICTLEYASQMPVTKKFSFGGILQLAHFLLFIIFSCSLLQLTVDCLLTILRKANSPPVPQLPPPLPHPTTRAGLTYHQPSRH